MRIVIADDHHVVRQGVRSLLETDAAVEIVGEATDGTALLQHLEEWMPDIVVLDLMMPGLNGLDALPQLLALRPETRVIVLSMHANRPYVSQALRAGARGYVLKDAPPEDLERAVGEVREGRTFLSAPLAERSFESYLAADERDPLARLTPREREVLHLVAEGLSSAEVAQKLFISPRTVEVHRNNLMRKLDLHRPHDLVLFAVKNGLLPLE